MLVIVFPIERSNMDPLNLRTIAHRAIGTLLRFPTSRLPWVGVGYSNNETDERDTEARAREKALVALGLGKAVWREPRVVLHDDVWIFDALCRDRRTLETVAALLDPLIAYDTEHGTDLVATVEAFSDADLSQADAARLLGVHRHTVSTRLLLAEQVLGRPLQVGPDRLLVELAPKARRLLYLT
jgi:DNA-binding PucR family transcriptional regulator